MKKYTLSPLLVSLALLMTGCANDANSDNNSAVGIETAPLSSLSQDSDKDSLISVTQADKAAYKEQIKSSEYDNISVSKDFELCFPKQKDASNAERLSLFRENFKFYKKAE